MFPRRVLISSSHGRVGTDPASPAGRHYLHSLGDTQGWVVMARGGRRASEGKHCIRRLAAQGQLGPLLHGAHKVVNLHGGNDLRELNIARSEAERQAICSQIATDLWETHQILERHADDPNRVFTCGLFIRISTPKRFKDYYKQVNINMLKLFDKPSQIINLDAVLRKQHICGDKTHLNKAGMRILRREIGKQCGN